MILIKIVGENLPVFRKLKTIFLKKFIYNKNNTHLIQLPYLKSPNN